MISEMTVLIQGYDWLMNSVALGIPSQGLTAFDYLLDGGTGMVSGQLATRRPSKPS